MIENFIGIFPNAASKKYCDDIITQFEYIQSVQDKRTGGKRIFSRQDEGAHLLEKDDNSCLLGLSVETENTVMLDKERILLQEFNKITWDCYEEYAKKYGILQKLSAHNISSAVKIQKYRPSQGYHVWHSDAGTLANCRRMLVIILYLNNVKEGGETEFLYQSTRISPVQGTLTLAPPMWPYTHRGNPPLSGNKYILTTWMEFME